MVALANTSDYPAFGFEHKLLVGNPYYIIILKQSFELKEDGTLKELDEQIDIKLHDTANESLRWNEVRETSDLIPYKPQPEVILNGVAKSATPQNQWLCGVDIKQIENNKINAWSKQILVTGSRYWQRVDNNWTLSKIDPTTKVRLGYENSYGGHFLLDTANGADKDNSPAASVSYPLNPAGKGWLPSAKDQEKLSDEQCQSLGVQLKSLTVMAAPQLFAINTNQAVNNLKTPYDSLVVAGFGSYANFWKMRTQYLSEQLDWSEDSAYGGYPVDFDMKHWQQAPADQWLDFELKGNEIVTLTGFFAEGKQSYALPTSIAYVLVRDPTKLAMKLDMKIDTLIIDTEKRTLEIVWRRIVLLTDFSPDTLIECNAFTTTNFKRL